MRLLYEKGLTSIYDGNISHRKKDSKYFKITPGGARKHTLTERDIVNVDINSDGSVQASGTASQELHMHANILLDATDEMYVVHCHPPHILAYIGDGTELATITCKFPELKYTIGTNVGYYPAGSNELADSVHTKLFGNDIVALEKHGVTASGRDLQKVVDMIEVLDYYCKIAVLQRTSETISYKLLSTIRRIAGRYH